MRRANLAFRLWSLAAVPFALAACDHKDLCFDHDAHAPRRAVRFAAAYEREWQYAPDGGTDWERDWPADIPHAYDGLRPAEPTGLRVLDYTPAGAVNTRNLPAEGGSVSFTDGAHSLLFYNNDTEYIVFDKLASYAEARATTRAVTRASYEGNPYVSRSTNENTVNAPDMLYGHYEEEYTPVASPDEQEMEVLMRPLVFTYVVHFGFASGLEKVALARGALAGMAQAVYLNTGRTAADMATVLFDCTIEPDLGGATAIVRSFGIPDYPNTIYSRSDNPFGLTLEVRLKNGEILHFDFDVTTQVASQPHGGVVRIADIAIPADAGGVSSAFQVEVDDWGEYEDIIVEIN